MAEPIRQLSTVSLQDFCDTALGLYRTMNIQEFMKYVLTGITHDGRQTSIDVILNAVQGGEIPNLRIARGYGALVGIDREIRVRGQQMVIWTTPRNEDAVKRNIHLTYEFNNEMVRNVASSRGYNHLNSNTLDAGEP